jgi:hypothetical protein
MDLSDTNHPVGFNVLDQGDPASAVDQLIDLLMHRFGASAMGVWAQEYLYHGFKTIGENPALSFVDIVTLLNPETAQEVEWVDQITRQVKDPELKRWWQRHDNRDKRSQQQRADPVLSRVWQLISRPELRYVMGQAQSSFKIADALRDNKILLVNLKGTSRDTASLAGTMMMNAIWHAAKATPKDKPTFLVLDEFADFMDLPIDTESMLAQARKHKLGMILANQHMAQLKPAVREAVLSNARNKVVLKSNADDARVLSRELLGNLDAIDFTSLQNYEAIAQVLTPIGTSSPVSLRTAAPSRPSGAARTVVNLSRQKYGRDVRAVQRDMETRHIPDPASKGRRPKIGGSGWGAA